MLQLIATFQAASQGRLVHWAVTRLHLSPRLPAVQRRTSYQLPLLFLTLWLKVSPKSKWLYQLTHQKSDEWLVKSNPLPFILPPQAVYCRTSKPFGQPEGIHQYIIRQCPVYHRVPVPELSRSMILVGFKAFHIFPLTIWVSSYSWQHPVASAKSPRCQTFEPFRPSRLTSGLLQQSNNHSTGCSLAA